jgi:hypothetical protein
MKMKRRKRRRRMVGRELEVGELEVGKLEAIVAVEGELVVVVAEEEDCETSGDR